MVRRIEVGINTDPMNRQLGDGNPQPQEIKDLAAGWVRFTLKDPNEGPQPTTLHNYNQLVDDLHNAGIKILMILSYETYPNWPVYTPGVEHPQEWAVYTDRFATRCRQIASHYGAKVQAYEIWNEPDHQEGNYNPKVDAKFFAPLLRDAYAAIKAVSSATVVMGGVASGQPPYVTQVMNETNGVLFADALGVHPYAQRPESNWPSPTWGGGVMTDQIRTYHNLARKPIWITEVGINPELDNIAFQAQFLKRTFKALNTQEMAQIAPCVFWYCWSHAMGQTFGLIGAAGEKRQSYDEFRAFALQSGPAVETAEARLRTELLARAQQEQRIQFNPHAALQASIFAHGFAPNSGEFSVPFGTLQYRAQRAEHLRTGEVRAYYAQVPLWFDVQFVTRPGPGDVGPTVAERLSVHSSIRGGEVPRYIIVHSSASAVGTSAEDALTLLVGPNPDQASAHEVVLPGDQVFRLVPDERAAHHLMGQNVQLPDGTSGSTANRATWGITAYQVQGMPVGETVLATTIERVVAACKRLGLEHTAVLGAGEVDPDAAGVPAGVDMDEFRVAVLKGLLKEPLLAAAELNQIMQFNPGAALQKEIVDDHFVPNSPEFDVTVDGQDYVAQRAEHLQSGKVRVYYANKQDVATVAYVTRQ
jgi:hypothetical protein